MFDETAFRANPYDIWTRRLALLTGFSFEHRHLDHASAASLPFHTYYARIMSNRSDGPSPYDDVTHPVDICIAIGTKFAR